MKKITVTLLAVCMAFMLAAASAVVPFALTTQTTALVSLAALNEEALSEELQVVFAEDGECVVSEHGKLSEFVKTEGNDPIEYFPEETRAEIGEMLIDEEMSENLGLSTLEIREFASVKAQGYQEAYEDILAVIDFATDYSANRRAAAVLGFFSGEKVKLVNEAGEEIEGEDFIVQWAALETEVLENGNLQVLISGEEMMMLEASHEACILVLSEPAGAGDGTEEKPGEAPSSSITITDGTQIDKIETTGKADAKENFEIIVVDDKAPIVREIEKMYAFVNDVAEGEALRAPAEYFPEEIQLAIKAAMAGEDANEEYDISLLELNEFVTVEVKNYSEEYGDVVAYIEFVTVYEPGQKVAAFLAVYTGETDAESGEYLVEWIPLKAIAVENGMLSVYIPAEGVLKIQNEPAVGMVVVNEAKAQAE